MSRPVLVPVLLLAAETETAGGAAGAGAGVGSAAVGADEGGECDSGAVVSGVGVCDWDCEGGGPPAVGGLLELIAPSCRNPPARSQVPV